MSSEAITAPNHDNAARAARATPGHRASASATRATSPGVSVLVPAYNAAPFLTRAVRSALRQTMADVEVIVVDDASTDATLEVARGLAAEDPRVRVLSNEVNQGEARTRNRALAAARGAWIALLDADDAWLPNRLERMLAAGQAADVVTDDLYRVEAEGNTAWSYLRYRWQPSLVLDRPRTIDAHDFLHHDLGVLQPIARRDFLERHAIAWDPSLRISPDFFFSFRLLMRGARWVQVPGGYYLYYANPSSILAKRWVAEASSVLEATRALLDDPALARSPALTADLHRFLTTEAVSLRFERARVLVDQGRWQELLGLLLREPRSLPSLARHIGRRCLAYGRRARAAVRVEEHPSGPILVHR
jgi:succinoglycan biosynthesis protein ExoO